MNPRSSRQTRRRPEAVEIRVRGRVQGVGFRPNVWRMARQFGLAGEVFNDSQGVVVCVGGAQANIEAFIERLRREAPPLSRIDAIETRPFSGSLPTDFRIAESVGGGADTQVAPDAAICAACAAEISDASARRHRYAFTNCTHCGPRLTVVTGIPYDRARTTMARFVMCEACARQYADPSDRRFHAQPIACPNCGPLLSLARMDRGSLELIATQDPLEAACRLLKDGEIVAVKALGGYQLACDATDVGAVTRLRRLKHRDAKPFALMAEDLATIRAYCDVSEEEARLLSGPSAPIVLLRCAERSVLPEAIAPGLRTLGFMLPTTPLHMLLVRGVARPLVMTSGNLSDEPQVTDDAEAPNRLGSIAPHALTHDREIANRIDDSVSRMMDGAPRLLRRARGFAPAPIVLPPEFKQAPPLLAFGGQLKATFCLFRSGEAILSPHLGDLENAATFDDYRKSLAFFSRLFEHAPRALVADRHPEYASTKLARSHAGGSLALLETQHHHAHIAACLAENLYPLRAPPVLGVVLDGLGLGDDDEIWGGEFLLADYLGYRRLGALKPAPMPGGERASREPWRNLYAHIATGVGWAKFADVCHGLEVLAYLEAKPLATLDAMVRRKVNAPPASSCGRLFDAFAALVGLCRDRQAYEGQAGALLEASVEEDALRPAGEGYPFGLGDPASSAPAYVDPDPMWSAALDDLRDAVPLRLMAARFHVGLAEAVARMAQSLAREDGRRRFDTIALSGGCFQNRILFEEIARRLRESGFAVLSHTQVPANDGGLSLGQAAIGAGRLICT
ncbi:MAG TPA: carbamoyltransferase HypF [Methylocystis sp.]|nr:carbamoyltransferase HypF [Methylocystis sp.]